MSVAWPRTLRFFEARYEILRRLEASKLLRHFNVAEDRVGVRLGDANHELVYTSTRLELALLQPTAEVERARMAVEVIFEHLQPTRLVRPEFVFQWIVPTEEDYDSARRTAAGKVFPVLGQSLTDFALLCDGRREEDAVTFRLECGIAEAAEFPIRLSRQAGQLVFRQREEIFTEPSLWPRETLPSVGFFCDSLWQPDKAIDTTVSGLFQLWEGTQTVAELVVSGVMEEFGLERGDE
jgi:hypothetical protein